jgi:hypothetical protein
MTSHAPDRGKDTIDADIHRSEVDTEKINRAIERVSRGDDDFINRAISHLKDLQFPAFKHKILEHAKTKTQEQDIIGLFESLDGYFAFKDEYHVRKAIEENGTKYKQQFQMSDNTRRFPNFNTRPTRPGGSIKEKEVVNKSEERKDYPEIPPTTRLNYICKRCGKEFLNQNDLIQHQRFEGS